MKKYRKNNKVAKAVQYDGSLKSIEEIKELLKDTSAKYEINKKKSSSPCMFVINGISKRWFIHKSNWIIKDGKYYFVSSDDIFKEMYIEIKE